MTTNTTNATKTRPTIVPSPMPTLLTESSRALLLWSPASDFADDGLVPRLPWSVVCGDVVSLLWETGVVGGGGGGRVVSGGGGGVVTSKGVIKHTLNNRHNRPNKRHFIFAKQGALVFPISSRV